MKAFAGLVGILVLSAFAHAATPTDEAYFYFGTKLVASLDANAPATVYHYLTDHLGSVRAITDSVGAVQFQSNYAPFGHSRAETQPGRDSGIKYAGKEADTKGVYHVGARYYAPTPARFSQPDPILRQTESAYAYARNNPFKYIDPDGKNPLVVLAPLAAAGTAMGIAAVSDPTFPMDALDLTDGWQEQDYVKAGFAAFGMVGGGFSGRGMREGLQGILGRMHDVVHLRQIRQESRILTEAFGVTAEQARGILKGKETQVIIESADFELDAAVWKSKDALYLAVDVIGRYPEGKVGAALQGARELQETAVRVAKKIGVSKAVIVGRNVHNTKLGGILARRGFKVAHEFTDQALARDLREMGEEVNSYAKEIKIE